MFIIITIVNSIIIILKKIVLLIAFLATNLSVPFASHFSRQTGWQSSVGQQEICKY